MAKKKTAKKKEKKEVAPKETKQSGKKLNLDFSTDDAANQFVSFCRNTEPSLDGIEIQEDSDVGVKDVIYSGLPNLDFITALKENTKIYGFPFKMLEIFGIDGSGKTTLLKYIAAQFIKQGGVAIYYDFEHKFHSKWFNTIAKYVGLKGDDYKKFLYHRPEHFEGFMIQLIKRMKSINLMKEQAKDKLKEIEKKKRKSTATEELEARCKKIISMPFVILVDSIANMYTKSEVEGEEEDKKHVGELARGFGAKLRLARRYLKSANILVIFSNQQRDKIETGFSKRRGKAMTTPGGKAVKCNCDGRLLIYRSGALERTRKNIKKIYGTKYVIKNMKNQMGIPPFRSTELHLLDDRGFHTFYSILESCVEANLIKKIGNDYKLKMNNEIISFGMNELDEIEEEYPKLESLLHRNYQKFMASQ